MKEVLLLIAMILSIFRQALVFAVDEIVIADFETLSEGKFPESWGVKKGLWYVSGDGNKTWKVKKENNNRYLSADSRGDSFTIGKKYEYSLEKFKYLNWRWRIHTLPTGGMEKDKETGDSAAGVYVIFDGFVIPYSIKYVWSSTMKVGTIVKSPFSGRTRIIVIRSGKEYTGSWIEEKRNVYEDFKKAFNVKSPDKKLCGIAVLTDSDNTGSRARADYDNIVATIK